MDWSSTAALPTTLLSSGGLLLLTAVVTIAFAAVVWRTGRDGSDRWLAVVMISTAAWAFCYAAEVSATTAHDAERWAALKFVGISGLPIAWLGFVLAYTGRRQRLGWRLAALLSVEPLVVLGLLSSERTHQLVRYYQDVPASALPVAQTGPMFYVHLVYVALLLWGGMAVLVARLSQMPHVFRPVTRVLLASVLVPWVLNVLYNLGILTFGGVDITPFVLLASETVFLWGLMRVRSLGVHGVPRSKVFDTVRSPVVVLDEARRVIDANLAGVELLGAPLEQAVGQPLEAIAPVLADAIDGGDPSVDLRVEVIVAGKVYDVVASPLASRDGRASGTLLTAYDVTTRNAAEREYERRSLHDPLTGLPNRELLLRRLRLVSRDAPDGTYGVLFVDVDEFKAVNDRHGHRIGDAVLVEVAQRLRLAVREHDTVARLGGDEFAVLVEDVQQPDDLLTVASHVVEAMHAPIVAGDRRVEVRVSVGVATSEAVAAETLLELADRAMYTAKARGRNRYEVYVDPPQVPTTPTG